MFFNGSIFTNYLQVTFYFTTDTNPYFDKSIPFILLYKRLKFLSKILMPLKKVGFFLLILEYNIINTTWGKLNWFVA